MSEGRRRLLQKAIEWGRSRFWASDEGLTALLASTALFIFVVVPLDAAAWLGPWAATVIDLWIAIMVLSGIAAVSRTRASALITTGLLVAFLAVQWAGSRWNAEWLTPVHAALALAVTALIAFMVLVQVYRPGPVTVNRIKGAVAAYLLVGVAWSHAFALLLALDPAALQGVSAQGDRTYARLVYFSFVTLSSTGYGDITPTMPASQSLANLESVVGQLFPAVLLARLVSLELTSRPNRP